MGCGKGRGIYGCMTWCDVLCCAVNYFVRRQDAVFEVRDCEPICRCHCSVSIHQPIILGPNEDNPLPTPAFTRTTLKVGGFEVR